MTKPESSKKKCSKVKESITIKVVEDDKVEPSSAKELFEDFVPDSGDDVDEDNNGSPATKKAKKIYQQKYRKEWENLPDVKTWLSESVHGESYFYCKLCKKDNKCGITVIQRHMQSKKHIMMSGTPAFKAKKFKFTGLLCPVFTPFTNATLLTSEINHKAIKKYSNFLNACNVKGILINDLTGEGMALTTRERIQATDAWAEVCHKNNQFLMVQIGGAPLKDIIDMAKHAQKREVGAVVVLPDLYNRPKSHLDVIKYLKCISEHTENIPLLYHHNPKHTQTDIDIVALLLDITDEIDTFVGLIYSSSDLTESLAALDFNREKFTVIIGTDEAFLGAAASGFTSIMSIGLNFLPKLVESIYESVQSGKIKEAQVSQKLLNKAISIITHNQSEKLPAFKAATDVITGTCGVTMRAPLQTLWEGTVKKLETKLREIGVL